MTTETFAEKVVQLWHARQRFEVLQKKLNKEGLVRRTGILRRKWRANPALAEYTKTARTIKALTAELGLV